MKKTAVRIVLIFVFICSIYSSKSYPNPQTAAYCALSLAFQPTPAIFTPIIDFCGLQSVPSISCNGILCGLSTEVIDNLTQLVISKDVRGTIPRQIGNLVDLTYLDFSANLLESTIPTQIGNLIYLVEVDLSSNMLYGTIPTQIGHLSNLRSLNLLSNQLSGQIPTQIGLLNQLESMILRTNDIGGTLPSQLGNMQGLTYLDLGHNNVSGTIPKQIGNLPLIKLYFDSNKISGVIPTELGKLTKINYMFMQLNELSGTLPTQLDLKELSYLELSYNQLFGTFPNYVNLQGSIFLKNNQLSGTIHYPYKAQSLILSNNQLSAILFNTTSGNKPPPASVLKLNNNSISSINITGSNILDNLMILDLSNNNINSIEIMIFPDLKELSLSGCNIVNSLDNLFSSLIPSVGLEYLDLSFNQLYGTIPHISFSSLTSLILANNLISE